MKYLSSFFIFCCFLLILLINFSIPNSTAKKVVSNNRNLSFAIVQLNDKKNNIIIDRFIKNKKEYTELQGYSLIIEESIDKSRQPHWSKILAVLNAFNKGYEWVWLLDRDTIITNFNIKVHYLAWAASKKDIDIMITKDCQAINSGSILFRNTDFSRKFLNTLWNSFGNEIATSDDWAEQRAFIYFHDKTSESKKKILFLPQNSINSYPVENTGCQTDEKEWKIGHFVLHFAGLHRDSLYEKYLDLSKEIKIDSNKFNTETWLDYINLWIKAKYNVELI